MANLSVNLCGVDFKNPVIAASGCFGFGREYDLICNRSEILNGEGFQYDLIHGQSLLSSILYAFPQHLSTSKTVFFVIYVEKHRFTHFFDTHIEICAVNIVLHQT